eukprot:5437959-Pyramimonas_sp.AAC.1
MRSAKINEVAARPSQCIGALSSATKRAGLESSVDAVGGSVPPRPSWSSARGPTEARGSFRGQHDPGPH